MVQVASITYPLQNIFSKILYIYSHGNDYSNFSLKYLRKTMKYIIKKIIINIIPYFFIKKLFRFKISYLLSKLFI